MKYRIYVIRDTGADETCLPFFVQSDVVARRQFAATLRTLPPSCRSDFNLEIIGEYDSSNCQLYDGFACDIIARGSDSDIEQMLQDDAPFYMRGNIDRAPVNTPEDK